MDLNTAWFVLVAVLISGYAVLDGFDLGVGVLSLWAKSDQEKRIHLNAIGPVWDGNEVWLLTGGGALFAAFPAVYATVFSGFYLAMVLVLVGLIARAVSFEFRSKVASPAWRKVWDTAFGGGSLLVALLLGVAVGNILHGIKIGPDREYSGTFFDLLNPFSLMIGLLAVSMFVTHGAIYLGIKTDGELRGRAIRWAWGGWLAWATLFAVATIWAAPATGDQIPGALARPALWISVAITVAGLVVAASSIRKQALGPAFVGSSASIVGMIAIAASSLFPMLVPARNAPERALTIYNACSTPRTLFAMLVIALVGMPIVIAYTIFIYRVFKGKVQVGDESY